MKELRWLREELKSHAFFFIFYLFFYIMGFVLSITGNKDRVER